MLGSDWHRLLERTESAAGEQAHLIVDSPSGDPACCHQDTFQVTVGSEVPLPRRHSDPTREGSCLSSISCLECEVFVSRVLAWRWKQRQSLPTQTASGSSRVGLLPRGLAHLISLHRRHKSSRQCHMVATCLVGKRVYPPISEASSISSEVSPETLRHESCNQTSVSCWSSPVLGGPWQVTSYRNG